MHIALWIVQALLAALFFMSGGMKLLTPVAELGAQMPWVNDSPELLVRFIGLSEVLGAIGLIVPAATRIQPKLTGFAAIGLGIVMVLAIGMHAMMYGEFMVVPVNFVLLAMAGFVGWGRLVKRPIEPRTAAGTHATA